MIIMSFVRTYLMNRTSLIVQALTAIVYKRDPKAFHRVAKDGVLLTMIGALVSSWYNFNKETLALLWRERLTAIIHNSYFSCANYYHAANLPGKAAVRDADIILSRELSSISNRLTTLISLLISSLPPLVWFTFKLWRWRGLKFALIPHIYLLLAYEIAQRNFPKNIGELYRNEAIAGGIYSKVGKIFYLHAEVIC
jgi:ABC-type uncharacterized transport system fused permease/ATPase subunit